MANIIGEKKASITILLLVSDLTAAAIKSPGGLLPTVYGLDGLHPDASGKKLMGEKINAVWPQAKLLADRLLMKYQNQED